MSTLTIQRVEQVYATSAHPVDTFDVVTESGMRLEVVTNGNGGFGPVNVWIDDHYEAVKYRKRRH